MRFGLPEDLELMRSVVREFAEKEVGPSAGRRDETERADPALFARLAGLGLAGVPIPEEEGGSGGDWLAFAVALEELAGGCASTAGIVAAHTALALWPVHLHGRHSQGGALRALACGAKLGGGGDPARLPGTDGEENALSFAVSESGDRYVLNGRLAGVVNAPEADYYVVYARDPGKRRASFTAFLLERGTPGLRFGPGVRRLGLRALPVADAVLERCELPPESRLGREGQGERVARAALASAELGAAAQAAGIGGAAIEAAAGYARQRKQFGAPIAARQGIAFKLADMSAGLEAARLLAYQAAWRMNEGLPCAREAAIASRFAARQAAMAALEAVQVHGGYGYIREYRVERYLRDAKTLEAAVSGTGRTKPGDMLRIWTE